MNARTQVIRKPRRFVAMAAGLVTMAVMLLAPAAASASIYIWRDVTSDWANPNNWVHVGGSGPIGLGYPNGVTDVAAFTGTYTADRAAVFGNLTLTVGMILINSNHTISIVAGAGGSFVFDNGAAPAEIIDLGNSFSGNVLDAPVQLRSSLIVSLGSSSRLRMSTISETGGARAVTKRGGGFLHFFRPNSFTGRTSIEGGVLAMDGFAGGPGVSNDVVIGSTQGGQTIVFATGFNQIPDTARVVVNAGGVLQLADPERLGDLIVNDGVVQAYTPRTRVFTRSITMTGGSLQAYQSSQFVLESDITATSSAAGPAVITTFGPPSATPGAINLGATRAFNVNDGPAAVDLEVAVPVIGPGAGLVKAGTGTMRFSGAVGNTYNGPTLVRSGRLELARSASFLAIAGPLQVGDGSVAANVELMNGVADRQNIAEASAVSVASGSLFEVNSNDTIGSLSVGDGGRVVVGEKSPAVLFTSGLTITGGRVSLAGGGMAVNSDLVATSTPTRQAIIDGGGLVVFAFANRNLSVDDGPQAVDLRIAARIGSDRTTGRITKRGAGVALFEGNHTHSDGTTVSEGSLIITGGYGLDPITLAGGTLGGTGTVGAVTATGGRIAPGLSPGRLLTGPISLSSNSTLAVELNGANRATEYDQLAVTGAVSLGGASLAVTVGGTLPPTASFTIVENDGTDPVTGTFAGLAEGETVRVGSHEFSVSYRGGDGNDVVLANVTPVTYFLAEGATGTFFDDDLLIANPNTTPAPITLTFLLEGGRTIVERRTVPGQSRTTIHVDNIPGLEATSPSVKVVSDNRLPLIVERTMFWDETGYGGHTANAVAQPETRWIFAEGFQGFFDTFILLANANPEPATVTLTFLRERATPVVTTVQVAAFARKTVFAGDYPDLVGRAFGIVVEATRPVIAERAMYFASQPGRLWAGGHANTGIVAPATSWFHAEGATGGFFSTFILLSNPNDRPAEVDLRFLLSNGDVITRHKTLGAQARLTINPATEGDARLENAAVSTVVQSDVPIVSERSMYWPGEATPFGEGHNSSGVDSLSTRWGLAEGRLGGSRHYDTYILLANPGSQAAQVTITYLRESGAPIVKTYTVPPTSRFNVDVKTVVPELRESTFGARVEVTNNVPIAVERSMYWNAAGAFWAGGTNALGTPLR